MSEHTNQPGLVLWVQLAMLICFATSVAQATATVVIRTPDEIVIAADSAMSDPSGKVKAGSVCKIIQLGPNRFLTLMGLSEDAASKYDILRIVRSVGSRRSGTMIAQVDAVEAAATPRLQNALSRLKRRSPREFQSSAIAMSPLSLEFGGFDHGVLVVYERKFRARVAENGVVTVSVERHQCPGVDCPNGLVWMLGSPEGPADAAKFATIHPRWWDEDKLSLVRGFMEMVKDEEGVAPPTNILRITKAGAKWVCNENCQKTTSSR